MIPNNLGETSMEVDTAIQLLDFINMEINNLDDAGFFDYGISIRTNLVDEIILFYGDIILFDNKNDGKEEWRHMLNKMSKKLLEESKKYKNDEEKYSQLLILKSILDKLDKRLYREYKKEKEYCNNYECR